MDAYHQTNRPFVLGVGFPKTGNFAIEHAFANVLNYGSCYEKPLPEDQTCEQLVQTLSAHNCCFRPKARRLYKHIWQQFPQVKFLLTVEDSSSVWADKFIDGYSVVKRKGLIIFLKNFRKKLILISDCSPEILKCWVEEKQEFDRDMLIDAYEKWISKITIEIPRTHLLIYNVKSGWAPLCAFVDVSQPKCRFFKFITKNGQRLSKFKRGAVVVVVTMIPVLVIGFVVTLLVF